MIGESNQDLSMRLQRQLQNNTLKATVVSVPSTHTTSMIAVMILWESPTKYQTITFIMNGSDYSAITSLYIGGIGWDLLHPEHII
jgi:hypothetical protein